MRARSLSHVLARMETNDSLKVLLFISLLIRCATRRLVIPSKKLGVLPIQADSDIPVKTGLGNTTCGVRVVRERVHKVQTHNELLSNLVNRTECSTNEPLFRCFQRKSSE